MRNAENSSKLQGRGGGGGHRSNRNGGGFIPTSLRAIQSYWRNATTVASSTVRSAGASVASTLSNPEDDGHCEQVQWAGFDKLELGANVIRRVLLLGYTSGFQVWDVEEAENVRQLISKQDGRVEFLQMQPRPLTAEKADEGFNAAQPLLLVVTGDGTLTGSNVHNGYSSGYGIGVESPPNPGSSNFVPTVVQFYSLRSHSYVHVLRFRQAVYTVRCSPRFVAVALASQIRCYDATTLENTYSMLTYPIPQGVQATGSINIGFGPLAVGPRWLAYAANHALVSNTGRVSPQHLTPSPGVSPSTSPANGSLVAHYAKESSKQIAAGIVSLSDIGYKTFTKYCSELLPDGNNSPRSGSPSWKHSSNGLPGHAQEPDYAGMVIVRDYVNKSVVAQFRAHTSPISALCFDPSGTLLVTASVYGHNLNVFRILTSSVGNGPASTGFDPNTSYLHLYKLCRGLTNAVIQDICFSDDSHWIAISSSRGTSHLFAISPFGGHVNLQTHESTLVDESRVSSLVPRPTMHWWSSPGPLRANQQPSPQPAPPVNLSVVSRIRNGNGGWRGTVSGAAAVATGRTASTGAIAAVFHNGGCGYMQPDNGKFFPKDELWIFSPSGYVIQYGLCLSTGVESGYCSDISSGIAVSPCEPSLEQDLRVVVKTLRKWDVCQIPNRVEREEDIENLVKHVSLSEPTGKNSIVGYRNGTIPMISQGLVKEGVNFEEKRHLYLSNAEVPMHQARIPVWAKSEVYFQVMMPDSMDLGLYHKDGYSGEIELERIPTHVVEVRTKDLVPVFDNIQNLKEIQGERDPFPQTIVGTKNVLMHELKDECIQDGISDMNLGCVEIQRSSSGSSCGSATGYSVGHRITANGYDNACQGSQDNMDDMLSSDTLTSFGHHAPSPTISEEVASLESPQNVDVKNTNSNGKSVRELANRRPTRQPPLDIPRGNRAGGWNIRAYENSVQMSSRSRSLPLNGCGVTKKYVVKDGVTDAVGVTFEGYIIDGLVSAKTGLACHDSSKAAPALSHVSEENENHVTSLESHLGGTSIPHIIENHARSLDLAVSSCAGEQLQDDDGRATDADLGTKVEDFIKEEHEEDTWEGGMFLFCDEE